MVVRPLHVIVVTSSTSVRMGRRGHASRAVDRPPPRSGRFDEQHPELLEPRLDRPDRAIDHGFTFDPDDFCTLGFTAVPDDTGVARAGGPTPAAARDGSPNPTDLEPGIGAAETKPP